MITDKKFKHRLAILRNYGLTVKFVVYIVENYMIEN
jgi:hypothetical protein